MSSVSIYQLYLKLYQFLKLLISIVLFPLFSGTDLSFYFTSQLTVLSIKAKQYTLSYIHQRKRWALSNLMLVSLPVSLDPITSYILQDSIPLFTPVFWVQNLSLSTDSFFYNVQKENSLSTQQPLFPFLPPLCYLPFHLSW